MANKINFFKNLLEPTVQNDQLYDYVANYIADQFPIKGKKQTLELEEISLDAGEANPQDFPREKEIKLKGGTLSQPVYGNLVLRDNITGKVVDKVNKIKLVNLPTVTNRYSMIIDGSEYQTINQLRLKSGIYTRVKENGDLESWFDLEKGYNFKMIFDPNTKLFYLVLANRKFKLYPILRALEFPEETMKKAWGKEIFDENQRLGINRDIKEIPGLVEKLTKKAPDSYDDAVKQLREYLDNTKVSPVTTKLTLGDSYEKVNGDTLFATSKKILGVLRGEQNPDERDSLVFKNLLTPVQLLSAYMDKQKPGILVNLKSRTDSKEKIRDIISSETYSKPLKRFYTTDNLSSTTEQTNPVSILGEWRKTTVMGTGGVQSDHAITMGVRDVHPSHMGFLDPINTPECLDSQALAFTSDGWKSVVDITLKDKLACNIDGKLHFLHPHKVQEFDYEGQLYTFENRKIKQTVTHNHRMWVRPIDVRSNLGYRIETAEEMYGKSRLVRLDHIAYEGNTSFNVWVMAEGRKFDIVDWCSLVGWQISEGSVRKYNYGSEQPYALAIAQTTPKNLPIIEKLLNRLNLNFKYAGHEFAVYDKELAEYFSQFGYCHEKYIPENLFEAPVEAREALLDALMKGDGRRTDPRNPLKAARMECETYTTTSKRLAEDVERLIISLGLAPSIKCYQDEREDRYLDVYEVRILAKSDTQLLPKKGHHSRKDFKGKVYGITVPGGLLYVKEEGYIPSWTGNSGKVGVTLPLAVDVMTDNSGRMVKNVIMPDGVEKQLTPEELSTMTLAFPDQWTMVNGKPKPKNNSVKVMSGGEVKVVPANQVEAWIESPWSLFAWPTNLIPFIQNDDAVRASFAAKMSGQAIPLDKKESALVQSNISGTDAGTFESSVGRYLSPMVPPHIKKATVVKITDDYIYLKEDGSKKTEKVGLFKNFPLNRETFLDSTPAVKVGDEVKSEQILATTNFQDDNDKSLALGLNVNVAYMPWKGLNYEDSAVITESLAKQFSSSKIISSSIITNKEGILNLNKFRSYFPTALTDKDSQKFDSDGVIKVGSTVDPEGILVAYMEPKDMTDSERILKSMNKSIYMPYRNRSLVWHGHTKGEVIYVNKLSRGKIVIHVKTSSPMVVGDKIAGRHGNKSIVSQIISDEEAPHTQDGKRIDLILSPNGVPGRMNPGQLLETAAGKIAQKAGKKFIVNNFSGDNYLKLIQDGLKQYDLKADDILLDGKNGKPFTNPIFNGNQYIMKLVHTVDHKAKARSYGSYSIEEQPSRGDEGGQKIDPLSTFALLSHGARENLREFAAIKSQKNDEIWSAIQAGRPIPPPQVNFAFEKLLGQLQGVGVNVNKNGSMLQLEPMTDEEILAQSNGKLESAGHMLIGKNLEAIKGGLFDKDITGGLKGKKWSHIELSEKMPHPLYEKPIMSIFKLTKPQFEKVLEGTHELPGGLTGAKGMETALRALNLDKEIQETRQELSRAPRTEVNKLNQRVRYLEALKKFGKNPADVYMIKNFPILPPSYRPIMALPSGDLNTAPINQNYRNLFLANKSLEDYKATGLESVFGGKARRSLYDELSYTVGTAKNTRPDLEKKTEGILITIAGKGSPKFGYAHNKLWGKRQDLSARSTITLDPKLGLDEIGLPEQLYKKVFLPFAVRELVNQGYTPLQAREHVKDNTPTAQQAFKIVMGQRPVLMNRAPSLHKHSVQAHMARPVAGSSIKLNPLIVKGYGADFDGDTMSVHVPVTNPAVEEAFTMLPSKNVWQPGSKSNVPAGAFAKDYMLGLWHLTRERNATNYKVKNLAEAYKLNKDGKIELNDTLMINGVRTSIGRQLVIKTLPLAMRKDYDVTIDKKVLGTLLNTIAKQYPNDFVTTIDALKDLALQFGHSFGSTISINDLDIDRSFRDRIVNHFKEIEQPSWSKEQKARHWIKAQKLVEDAQNAYIRKTGKARGFYDMLDSGSESKQDSVRQVITMPGVKIDVYGKPIPIPVDKSYAEGLDQGAYWMSLYGARKGMVDRAINTEQSGAINKALLGVTKSLLVVEHDCGTTNGVDIDINETKNLLDRFLAVSPSIGIGKAGQEVDNSLITLAKSKKINSLRVRSPLTCETPDGVCQKCYGIAEDGNLVALGTNIGVKEGQAMTERSTQLTMKSFHSGGSAAAEQDVVAGFPKMEQVLKVPEIVAGKATLASVRGQVHRIEKSAIGGLDVYISGVKHHIPFGRQLLVKKGDTVMEGDALSAGSIKPQELQTYKGYQAARLQMVNDLQGVFGKEGLGKKTFETVVRGIANQAVVDEAPEETGYIRGDTAVLSRLDHENKKRRNKGLPEIKYTPYFKSIETLALDNPDWLSKLTVNRIRETLKDGAAFGAASNLHSTDPMPAYLHGTEFNKDVDFSQKKFY